MIPLATEFTLNGWTHRQIRRSGLFAIYSRSKETSPQDHYEVIRIHQNKEREQFGKMYPAVESYPTDRQWGDNGWTYRDLEKAEAKFNELFRPPATAKKLKKPTPQDL